jgi:hypothetical protein
LGCCAKEEKEKEEEEEGVVCSTRRCVVRDTLQTDIRWMFVLRG